MLIFLISLSFLVSLATVAVLIKIGRKRLLDIPNQRSSHKQPTPRGGGLGFIVGVVVSLGCCVLIQMFWPAANAQTWLPQQPWFFWGALIPLAAVSFFDDLLNLPAWPRYLVQLLAASLAVTAYGAFPQPWLTGLGPIGVSIALGLTVIGMTAMINFYNFMDGLDGLVASVAACQFALLALRIPELSWLWLVVAALIGFLVWNWSPAKIFMGDVGSTFLGAVAAMSLLQAPSTSEAWASLTITLPLLGDALYTLIRRVLRRENILQAHRFHLYQRLHQAGVSHAKVAGFYLGLTTWMGLLVLVLGDWGGWLNLLILLILVPVGETYIKQHLPFEQPHGLKTPKL